MRKRNQKDDCCRRIVHAVFKEIDNQKWKIKYYLNNPDADQGLDTEQSKSDEVKDLG